MIPVQQSDRKEFGVTKLVFADIALSCRGSIRSWHLMITGKGSAKTPKR